MPSKQVTDRQKSTTAVVAAIDTHASAATAAISDILSPHLHAGEAMPDVALLLRLVGRHLTSEMQSLVAADNAHQAELDDDDAPRRERDETATIIRQESIELREVVTGIYGSAIAAQIIAGPAPRDPLVLSRFIQNIEDNLSRITLPTPRVAGATLDKSAICARFATLRQTLDLAIEKVAREVREAQSTLAAKENALDSFDHFFSVGASTTSDLLRLAGMPEQAARVRPSTRKAGQTVADADEDAHTAPTPPANG